MTDTAETTLSQALDLVDRGLSELQSREIVSASQVADMLLDLRLLLLDLDEGQADHGRSCAGHVATLSQARWPVSAHRHQRPLARLDGRADALGWGWRAARRSGPARQRGLDQRQWWCRAGSTNRDAGVDHGVSSSRWFNDDASALSSSIEVVAVGATEVTLECLGAVGDVGVALEHDDRPLGAPPGSAEHPAAGSRADAAQDPRQHVLNRVRRQR